MTIKSGGGIFGRNPTFNNLTVEGSFDAQGSISGAQAESDALTSIAGLTTAADKMIYATAADTYAVADLTSAGRALLDDADASAQRTTLGLGTIATQAADSVNIDGGAIDGTAIGANSISTAKFSEVVVNGINLIDADSIPSIAINGDTHSFLLPRIASGLLYLYYQNDANGGLAKYQIYGVKNRYGGAASTILMNLNGTTGAVNASVTINNSGYYLQVTITNNYTVGASQTVSGYWAFTGIAE